ncbi:Multifunctional methyltransferase subunit TRM112-like protein [Trichoplax sp. H2]|uniref:Multifunctional methyltransferase subunit TRM112-like protein n=1 Tax=Trichoplax adhaerens TaxID=10228 RepID=B3RJT0_TRIAD|nr:hypothetical protein TRIADDRAFT_52665 [Trichoplax adhaerens]EDV29836.1 hypothetical protein TRIADDRAFT_52665 [Trichoplax adhaerens]RDD43007.1 Multifunctional methyltransferase subunit TRM112-like protein [Trichoplax sp. H2]|eukprot:XP_002109038.1 hypothetical protein TRIADDRAFT_52665 [Trichoplax adhaerens]
MRLLTHNMLTSHVKGAESGYPLILEAAEVILRNVDFNPEFIKRMLSKVNWDVLYQTAKAIGHLNDIPEQLQPNVENDEEFLRKAHHVLLEVEVKEGHLICPTSKKKFQISNGIPNMLLGEESSS